MELYRLIAKKKFLYCLICLFFVQIILFTNMHYTNLEEEITSYSSSEFNSYIQEIIEKSDSMDEISIFNDNSVYSKNNSEQTKKDFLKLKDIKVSEIENKFLDEYFGFNIGYIICSISGIIIAYFFLDDKRKGIKCLIHTSKNGRGVYAIKKIGALLFTSTIVTMLYWGSTLILTQILNNCNLVNYLNYNIQSVSRFIQYTYKQSIGEYILVFFINRILITFIISLIWWIILTVCDFVVIGNCIALLGSGIEFLLYNNIKPSSSLEKLHYINIFYLISNNNFSEEYKNLNIFDNAVNKDILLYLFLLISIIFVCTISILYMERAYPITIKKNLKRIVDKFLVIKSKFLGYIQAHISIFSAEIYKLLIQQKGIAVIIVMVIAVVWQYDSREVTFTHEKQRYNEFIHEYKGAPSEKSEKFISDLKDSIKNTQRNYEIAKKKYEKNEISILEMEENERNLKLTESDELLYEMITNQSNYLKELKKDKNVEGAYINLLSYAKLLGEDNIILNGILVMMIVIIGSNAFVVEKKNKMEKIYRTAYHGRQKVYFYKLLTVLIFTVLSYCITAIFRLKEIMISYELSGFNAPIQSYYDFENFPINCTLGQYIVAYYLLRAVLFMAFAIVVLNFSIYLEPKIEIILMLCIGIALILFINKVLIIKTSLILIMIVLLSSVFLAGISIALGNKKWSKY